MITLPYQEYAHEDREWKEKGWGILELDGVTAVPEEGLAIADSIL